jgi:hypothetical protein
MGHRTRRKRVKQTHRFLTRKGKGKWTTTPITDQKELQLLKQTLENEQIREKENKKNKKIKDELERNRKESLTKWATTPMSDKDKTRLLKQQDREFNQLNSEKTKKRRLRVDDL